MRIKADRSINLCKVNLPKYIKILINQISEKYKLDYDNTKCKINNSTYK